MSKKNQKYEKDLLERLNEFIQVDKVYYQYVGMDERLGDTLFSFGDDGWLIINSHGPTEEFATVMNEAGEIEATYRYILAISQNKQDVKLYLTDQDDCDDLSTQIRELKTRSGKAIDISTVPTEDHWEEGYLVYPHGQWYNSRAYLEYDTASLEKILEEKLEEKCEEEMREERSRMDETLDQERE